MQVPLKISFDGIGHSDGIEFAIQSKIRQLERLCPSIIASRVLVGLSENRHLQGKLFRVRIDMTLPGYEIVVDRDPSEHRSHEDPYVALRDAFRAARRQLEDYVRINFRGKKRHHVAPPQGKVVRLLMEQDGGFLKTQDGREIYFNRNSVLNGGYEKIKLGDEVRYVEEMGEKGPQASSVQKIGKWGRHESFF